MKSVVQCRPVAAAALVMVVAGTVQVGAAHAASESAATGTQVSALGASRIEFAPVPTARYGIAVAVKGRVLSLGSNLGLGATDVHLTFDPVKGVTRTVTVRTDANGNFVARYAPRVRTTVRAVTKDILGGTISAVSSVRVEAPITCRVGQVREGEDGREVPGRCKVPGMPAGTKFRVQHPDGGVWHTVSTGRSKANKLSFVVELPRQATYSFRVYVFPEHKWVATPSQTFKVWP